MDLSKLISHSENFKNFIFLFLMFFLINNLIVIKAGENKDLIRTSQEESKLREFYSHNVIKYADYDNIDSQIKMFFGFDSENPETSFYPDSLIMDYSNYIRDMYKLKLNDLTIKK
jgi:hypothetical protein